jgi:hypothetical protein
VKVFNSTAASNWDASFRDNLASKPVKSQKRMWTINGGPIKFSEERKNPSKPTLAMKFRK